AIPRPNLAERARSVYRARPTTPTTSRCSSRPGSTSTGGHTMLRGILLLGSLPFLAPPSVTGATLTFPLTPAESSCAEQELARVERRLPSYGSGAIATSLGTN